MVAAISLAPLVFWLRHLGDAWKNSVRSVALARSLRRVVLAATVPYAFLALTLRVLTPPLDPRLSPILTALSLFAALFVYAIERIAGRRRRA